MRTHGEPGAVHAGLQLGLYLQRVGFGLQPAVELAGPSENGFRASGGSKKSKRTKGGRAFFRAAQMGDETGILEQNVAMCEIAPQLSLNSQCSLLFAPE